MGGFKMEKSCGYVPKKDESGTGGQTIEEKTASWKFYGMMSFIKLYIAGRRLVDVLLQKIFWVVLDCAWSN